jgi:hypothetical protein
MHAVALVGICQETMAQEGVFRWRTLTFEGRSSRFQADSDETDAFGRIGLSCVVESGNVEVSVVMKDEQRAKFAELLRSGSYPEITLSDGQTKSAIDKLEFSEVGGWLYAFIIPVDSKWLADFEKTGSLRLSVGTAIKDSDSLKVGLDAISVFRSQCRKKPKSRPPASQSSLPWTRPNPNAFPPPKLTSPAPH